jgi:two-component sensor histidine kinase
MNGRSQLDLKDVFTTVELDRRPSRPPDYKGESHALTGLMDAMAAQLGTDGRGAEEGSTSVLQKLVESALELCGAHSAGVSTLEHENEREIFRWRAAAGQWAAHRGEIMSRDRSETVVDRNTALLMTYPERHYNYVQSIALPIAEALLMPFYLGKEPFGVIWVISHDATRQFDAEDRRLITSLARFAGIACHLLNEERLASELAATQRLQEISTHLLSEDKIELLYDRILDAATAIMRSDFASMQKYFPERGSSGELRLLGHRGFSNEAASFWEWVRPTASCTCGVALRKRQRVIVPDVETCDFMAGSDHLGTYHQAGIRAVQSTPLMSRGGQVLGMISTHWRQPHWPLERDLRLLDVLARQAADLIERSLAEKRTKVLLREVSHRAKNILAMAQAMARQTAGEEDAKTFAQQFSARLAGLAASQELLLESDWRGVEAAELVQSQLSNMGDLIGTRVTFQGPTLKFTPAAAQTIGMALHELSTNAIKYGALSNSEGTVLLAWSITFDGSNRRFKMRWREQGGPKVMPPQRQGFGYSVIVRMIEHALDAEADLAYPSSGLDWAINAPAAAVLDGINEGNV